MISATRYQLLGAGVVRVNGFPFGWCFHCASGIWWLGVGKWRAALKSPWNRPGFSERHGAAHYYKLGGGWRLRFWFVQ